MDNLIEQSFVKIFIEKQMQDRILFELMDKGKRDKAISRFAHISGEIFKSQYIHLKGTKLTEKEIEMEIAKIFNIHEKCYLLNSEDGKWLVFREALKICMDDCMPSILICGEKVAFVKIETEVGSPMKYILHKT